MRYHISRKRQRFVTILILTCLSHTSTVVRGFFSQPLSRSPVKCPSRYHDTPSNQLNIPWVLSGSSEEIKHDSRFKEQKLYFETTAELPPCENSFIPTLENVTAQHITLNYTSTPPLYLAPASEIAYFYLHNTIGLSEETMWKITFDYGSILGLTAHNLQDKISLLTDSLDLSPEEIRTVISRQPSLLHLGVDNIGSTIDFLRLKLDFQDDDQLRKIVVAYPCVISYSISNLSEKIMFFTEVMKLSVHRTRKILTDNPQLWTRSVRQNFLLKFHFFRNEIGLDLETIQISAEKNSMLWAYSLEMNLKPKCLGFLMGKLGMTPKDMKKLFCSYPSLLDYNLGRTLLPITEYFLDETELGYSIPEFRTIVLKFPRIFTHSLSRKIRHVVAYLRYELGLDARQVKRVLFQAPNIINLMDATLQSKIEFLQVNLGLDYEELKKVITSMPTLLLCSIDNNLRPKVEYLEIAFEGDSEKLKEAILTQPTLLGYSLNNRIKPRMERLKSMDEDAKRITIGIPLVDAKFEEWIISSKSRSRRKRTGQKKNKVELNKEEEEEEGEEKEQERRKGRIVTWTRPRKLSP